jgi:hypothetical protein
MNLNAIVSVLQNEKAIGLTKLKWKQTGINPAMELSALMVA